MSGRLESEIARLCAEVKRLRAALAQQAEPVTGLDVFLDPHDGLKPKRYKTDPQIADRLARHGIVTCPDCRGIGYDASGQLCGCQDNPSFG